VRSEDVNGPPAACLFYRAGLPEEEESKRTLKGKERGNMDPFNAPTDSEGSSVSDFDVEMVQRGGRGTGIGLPDPDEGELVDMEVVGKEEVVR
jgi:hypothetical protein